MQMTEPSPRSPGTTDVQKLYRTLHQHPERAGSEVRTAGLIARHLRGLGLEVHTGIAGMGVVARFSGGKGDPGARCLVLRAPMDAQPLQEETELVYRSQQAGVMHACGHDAQMAMLLATATALSEQREILRGTVLFLFQPVSDTEMGAKAIIEAGLLEEADGLIGMHLSPAYPTGFVALVDEPFLPASNRVQIHLGPATTQTNEEGNVGAVASQILSALYALVQRETTPWLPARLIVSALTGDTRASQTATITGYLQTYQREQHAAVLGRMHTIAQAIATGMQIQCRMDIGEGYPPGQNDPALLTLVERAAVAVLGEEQVDHYPRMQLPERDDLACLLDAVPGCAFLLGIQQGEVGMVPQRHTQFTLDEEALSVGVEVLLRIVTDFLR